LYPLRGTPELCALLLPGLEEGNEHDDEGHDGSNQPDYPGYPVLAASFWKNRLVAGGTSRSSAS